MNYIDQTLKDLVRQCIYINILCYCLFVSTESYACSVCFGDPNSTLTTGLNMGILSLLSIVIFILGSFMAFFVYLYRRSRNSLINYVEGAQK